MQENLSLKYPEILSNTWLLDEIRRLLSESFLSHPWFQRLTIWKRLLSDKFQAY